MNEKFEEKGFNKMLEASSLYNGHAAFTPTTDYYNRIENLYMFISP